jgi:ectoine hydroxylase-related dioxygenase (phytanoyl-CoA dioxygenase family)
MDMAAGASEADEKNGNKPHSSRNFGHNKIMATLDYNGSLSATQLEHYDGEGYIVFENLLDEADMTAPREAMMQKTEAIAQDLLQNGLITDLHEDEPFPTRLARLFEGLSDQDFLKYGRGWRDRLPGYFHLMSNPKILDAVESLIGSEIFSNPVYNVRPKVPGVAAGAVPWHQDKSYWPDANANPVITVWIPLVDSTHENGCLHLIPRTHKKRVVQHGTENYSGTSYYEIAPTEIQNRKAEIIALPMKAGSAVLFNDRLIHSSTPNRANHVRWSVDLRYQPTSQDPMPQHGIGFLARSRSHPERVANLDDWLANRMEHPVNQLAPAH